MVLGLERFEHLIFKDPNLLLRLCQGFPGPLHQGHTLLVGLDRFLKAQRSRFHAPQQGLKRSRGFFPGSRRASKRFWLCCRWSTFRHGRIEFYASWGMLGAPTAGGGFEISDR